MEEDKEFIQRICNILELDVNCTREQLEKKKREKLKYWHPDKNKGDSEEMRNEKLDKFFSIMMAYEFLKQYRKF